MDFTIFYTPIGFVKITEDGGYIVKVEYMGKNACEAEPKTNLLSMAKKQMTDYFQGSLKQFSLPIKLNVSTYYKQVLEELMKVEYGTTVSYKQLAQLTGNPNASRAVGSAMRNNPLAIIVPCHRVLPQSGKIGNYSFGGAANKEWLLCHEKQNA